MQDVDFSRFFGSPDSANGAVEGMTEAEIESAQRKIEGHIAGILDALRIDHASDHNTRETPRRVAKMMMRETFAGRFAPLPALTDFPNVSDLDQLYVVGPITVRSCCSHHLCPIEGEAWCGVLPGERVIGLSKFSRLTDWIMARPQIQEEATVQLADLIETAIRPRGLGVIVRARHSCMAWRGVRDNGTRMTTSVMRGVLRHDAAARAEFLALAEGAGFAAVG